MKVKSQSQYLLAVFLEAADINIVYTCFYDLQADIAETYHT